MRKIRLCHFTCKSSLVRNDKQKSVGEDNTFPQTQNPQKWRLLTGRPLNVFLRVGVLTKNNMQADFEGKTN